MRLYNEVNLVSYKDKVQEKNENKLHEAFERDKTPLFIRKYLFTLSSKASARNYYIALRGFFLWLIDNDIIMERSILELTADSFNNIEPSDIFIYLKQRQDAGMSRTTLLTRRNIFLFGTCCIPKQWIGKEPCFHLQI